MIKAKDTIKLATRMFRTRPARTWLTILGIGVGISAVVILVGFGYGLQRILLEKIVFGEALLSLDVITPPSQILVINDKELEEFKKVENVEDIAPLANFNASLVFEGLTSSVMLRGVDPPYFRYAGVRAEHGELFVDGEKDKIVLSSAILKLFEKEPGEIVGKRIGLKVFVPDKQGEVFEMPLNKEYEIKGIIDDETSLFLFIPLDELRSQFAIPYYERVRVKVIDREVLTQTEEEFLSRGFLVYTLSKTVDQANKIFGGVQVMLAIFGGIALVVSAIGMFNTMTVTLLERTKEIGIMRTIGASNLTIQILFESESILMGFLGGVSGVIIGAGSGLGLNLILGIVARRMGGQPVNLFEFPIMFLIFMIISSAILGGATGFFPARRASKLNPLDAIRYN